MILIPELKMVFIRVPRTASGSMKRAILTRYPKAIELYHHMEADGVPGGYDRWQKVGVARDPVDRLWSLYKFSKRVDKGSPSWLTYLRRSVEPSFNDWIVNNNFVFTNPYSSSGSLTYHPEYSVRHSLPETRKSQFLYLRPDLGTRVVPYQNVSELAQEMDLDLQVVNETDTSTPPRLSAEAFDHIKRFHGWDLENFGNWRAAA
jgi:hypothetical protein